MIYVAIANCWMNPVMLVMRIFRLLAVPDMKKRTDMDNYKKLAKKLITNFNSDRGGVLQLSSELCLDCKRGANAITDLLIENQSLRNAANGFKARAEVAEARCKAFEKMVREYRDEIVPRYMEMAENAEMERDEAVEVICARCSVLPCRKNECHWYRFKKEE